MERRPKHWVLPECRGGKHQTHPQAPFSSISFPARGKRYGRRRRVRTGLDGTSPRYSRSLFSSEPVSSFPNRKLNLRFGFFYANLQQPLSQPDGCQHPYPFCPFGTFPPDRGNRPLEGEPFPRKKVTSIWISKAPSIASNRSTATSCKPDTPISGGAQQKLVE